MLSVALSVAPVISTPAVSAAAAPTAAAAVAAVGRTKFVCWSPGTYACSDLARKWCLHNHNKHTTRKHSRRENACGTNQRGIHRKKQRRAWIIPSGSQYSSDCIPPNADQTRSQPPHGPPNEYPNDDCMSRNPAPRQRRGSGAEQHHNNRKSAGNTIPRIETRNKESSETKHPPGNQTDTHEQIRWKTSTSATPDTAAAANIIEARRE